MKIKTVQQISVQDWDRLVKETYGRPYSFQQQDGCRGRGVEYLDVPTSEDEVEDFENDTIPEIVNHPDMGVSFKSWLARDPKQELPRDERGYSSSLDLWWSRNFYPHIDMIAYDLYKRGLLPEGEYQIVIDW